MFNNKRYITRGIDSEIPLWLQIFMWECVDRMPEPKDYFQVFELSNLGGIQRIVHSSEQPEYRMNYFIPTNKALTAKVYIIDSDEYATMLLASEY